MFINNKKKIFAALGLLSLFIISACSVMKEEIIQREESGNKVNRRVIEPTLTKGGSIEDSLRVRATLQSDKSTMLINQIKSKDGYFYLGLDQTDAEELHIPDSLYFWAIEFVNSLNAE